MLPAVAKKVNGLDDLIAGADIQGHQGDEEGIGAAGDADGMATLSVLGQLPFECLDFWPQDKASAGDQSLEFPGQLGTKHLVFASQIQ